MKKKNYGFTLIELLAVIIILGILMVVAIPSVTNYIQTSRKNGYATTAREYVKGFSNIINSGKLNAYDPDTTYYYPIKCIATESGGNSPFGDWKDAYVVFTANDSGFDYYWTSADSANMGIYLTYSELINSDSIVNPMTDVDTTIGIGSRKNIVVFGDDCSSTTSSISTNSLQERGSGDSNLYLKPDFTKYIKASTYDNSGNGKLLGYSIDKSKVEYIYTVKTNVVPSNAIAFGSIPQSGADISGAGDGSVMMWVLDEDNNGLYELYLGQKGGVVANANSSYLFGYFTGIKGYDLSNLYTDKVTNMSFMFSFGNSGPRAFKNCTFDTLDLSHFNTSNVTDMRGMFWGMDCITSINVSSFDTSKVKDMSSMFTGLYSLKSLNIDNFNTSKVEDFSSMFTYNTLTSLNLPSFTGESAIKINKMFAYSYKLVSLNIPNFTTPNVTSMLGVFADCTKLKEIDLSNWDTSNVNFFGDGSNYNAMFAYCSDLETIYVSDKWTVNSSAMNSFMFNNVSKLTGGNGTKYSADHKNADYAHIDEPGNPGYFTRK